MHDEMMEALSEAVGEVPVENLAEAGSHLAADLATAAAAVESTGQPVMLGLMGTEEGPTSAIVVIPVAMLAELAMHADGSACPGPAVETKVPNTRPSAGYL